ncbi:MAG: ECF-type sigma factor [Planctomycetota bacterium]
MSGSDQNSNSESLRAPDEWTQPVYDELRGLAAKYFGSQPKFHTLQPTALVNEAWIRMSRHESSRWQDAKHFRNVAALAMRQVLTDHARERAAGKRRAGPRVPLTNLSDETTSRETDCLDLLDAVERLGQLNARHADVVALRFFGGLTVSEVATALEISKRSVEADWQIARAWLLTELSDRDRES